MTTNSKALISIKDLKVHFPAGGAGWFGRSNRATCPRCILVIAANVGKDGGPQNLFDPENGYRNHYKAIWGR